MPAFELRARCPQCSTVRVLWGPHRIDTAGDLDAAETLADIKRSALAHCLMCDAIEFVAMFVDGAQTEPWLNADEYERINGPGGGPLPPKPNLPEDPK